MPELPEVEVTKRGLVRLLNLPSLVHLKKIEYARADLRFPIPQKKLQSLEGARVLQLHRRAKYLLMETDQGVLLSHFGMTGTWQARPQFEPEAHDHVRLTFSSGLVLVYNDPRRFGYIDYMKDMSGLGEDKHFQHLGPEPLLEDFNGASLWAALRKSQRALKVALMDQKVVVGVGNIYASEALFRSGIRPHLNATKLSKVRADRLCEMIKAVLSEAIAKGGSSISDYAGVSGESGYFQNSHQVYGREGQPCVVCKQQIRAQDLGGRSTFWCPRCQAA